jgi:hypothetical protein
MWDLTDVRCSNSKKHKYYNKIKGNFFLFSLKEKFLRKNQELNTFTHLKKISKISSHPSQFKIKIYDHIKIKENDLHAQENFERVDTWEDQIIIMINKPQIHYILKTGLQRIVEIVPKIALLKFQKIYSLLHILEIVNVFVLKTRVGL